MNLIGAALGGGVDDGAGGAAILGAVVAGLHAELADRVRRQLHHLVGKALVAGAVGVVIHAIDHEIVERAALAVDVERRVAAGRAAVLEHGLADAGSQQREIRIGAAVQRQIDDRGVADHVAAAAGIGLDGGCGARHFDRLGHVADLQVQIDALVGVYGYSELLGHCRL